MCSLRYTACTAPVGPTWTQVLASFSSPGMRSRNDPATRSTPSSAAVCRAQETAWPSSGSAAPRSSPRSEDPTLFRSLLPPREALQERPGDEVHAQLGRRLPRPGDGLAVERFGRRAQLVLGAHRRPLLGEHDQLSAIRGGGACETIGGGEVRAEVGGGVQLNGRCLHLFIPFAGRGPTRGK